ncbi:MAG: glutamate racemase [Lachnospiraceae bacterium]|nr:glutamate racemase [Lachnospiraceae bacterium]
MARIGLFDSGVGGITVLHEVIRMPVASEVLYYMDTAHVPYGTKSVTQIRGYAEEIVRFLRQQGAELIVIACNTATSAAAAYLRERFDVPIVGMEPAVKPALALQGDGKRDRVLVLATPLTLREKKLADLIAKYDASHRVDLLAMPGLVTFAEEERFDTEEVHRYIRETLKDTDTSRYRAVVPGCTHFRFFLPELREVFPEETSFVDGTEGTVHRIADLLGEAAAPQEPADEVLYYNADVQIKEQSALRRIARLHERLDRIG